ncbi:hypothetical protein ADIARSV_0261 [Arcticibacter svalbardensis MN12-7]|uniref:Uncharacterized protein n=1 Tax=Arcticibacter svalbardensis MN12-7 TaxID=1150600 RepID=R9GXI8_9SPHI|nr:DUF5712 family protein [Arcticibacter svalbardensis]EOR96532.1 hypothetical protein ADIARSV_0261 [Arcticibacter svalbardensis MN12-7]
MHIQIIVSRKDATNRIKLSPMNKSKGKNEEHSKKLGQFNRVAFKQSGENLFDTFFQFDRGLKDTMAYANIGKNGNLNQRQQLDILEAAAEGNPESKVLANELSRDVAIGLFNSVQDLLLSVGHTAGAFLEILLDTPFDSSIGSDPNGEEKKRKKRVKVKIMD